jgi:hypothetical protein
MNFTAKIFSNNTGLVMDMGDFRNKIGTLMCGVYRVVQYINGEECLSYARITVTVTGVTVMGYESNGIGTVIYQSRNPDEDCMRALRVAHGWCIAD